MRQLLPYAQLVRLPNVFTAWADIVLGGVVTGAVLWYTGAFACLLAASTLLYWGGMVWNDYFDLEQDAKERPGRPIPSGRVPVGTALWLGIGLCAGGVLFAFLADVQADALRWVSTSVAVLLVAAILLYDGALKQTWAGPLTMGVCRFLNVLLGLSATGDFPPAWGFLLAAVVGLYIAGVTLFARSEARASKQTDLIAAAAVMGFSLLLALAVPALTQLRLDDATTSTLFPYLLVAFAFFLGLAIVPAIRNPSPGRVQPAVKRALLGLTVLDALLLSAIVGTAGLSLVLLLVPGVFLGRWVYST